jgi:DNA-binding FadR family transcriptional regulator
MEERALRVAVREALLATDGIAGRMEFVVERIRHAIELGLIEIGEQLPSEAEAAAGLGVSPVTLREALAVLREAGYVETRRGRGGGTFVRRRPELPTRRAALERLATYSVGDLRDLGDYHAAVSGSAAALAAERASPGELEQLRSLVQTMRRSASFSDYQRIDSRLHMEIAAAARSQRLMAAETELQAELREVLWPGAATDDLVAQANREHGRMLAAVRARDADRARRVAMDHVRTTTNALVSHRLAQLSRTS